MLAGFLARDCYEGIQTCDLWVSVLIRILICLACILIGKIMFPKFKKKKKKSSVFKMTKKGGST
jgi:hypothetical protein